MAEKQTTPESVEVERSRPGAIQSDRILDSAPDQVAADPPAETRQSIDEAIDHARSTQIRLVFGDRFPGARDHLIVQGMDAAQANETFNILAAGEVWNSPAGGSFGPG